jgi:hypothetical protein
MAEGTKTYMGLAVPLYGESEIQQQALATDILTLTGATSQSGDFLVCQGATGTEYFVVASSGSITARGAAFTGAVTVTGAAVDFAISSTTSTNYGIGFTLGASAVVDALIKYTAGITGATTSVFQVSSTNGPSYLLSVGTSAGAGVGAAVTNGFFNTALKYVSAPSTSIPMGTIKMLAGSKAYYILAIPDTAMA